LIPPRAMRSAVALLVLLAALTGCIGGDQVETQGSDASPTANLSSEGATLPGTEAMPAGFLESEPLDAVRWENGSFHVTEHSYPKGMITGIAGEYDPDRRSFDISDMVPTGVPVTLTAEVNADLGEGDVDLWIQADPGAIWSADYDTPYGGYSRIEVTLVYTGQAPVEVVVRYDEIDDSESFDYTLSIRATHDPMVLPPGLPVELALPGPASTVQVEAPDADGEAAAMLFDPDDQLVERVDLSGGQATFELAEDAQAGDYVLFITESSGLSTVTVLGAEQPVSLTPTKQAIAYGEPVSGSGGQASWTFEVPRAPLQAGIFWSHEGIAGDATGSLVTPAGEALHLATAGHLTITGSYGMLSDMGEAKLVAGTYEASAGFSPYAGPSEPTAMHVLVFYERG
ncbi:MAG: hypothetical protein R3185_05740, partial [Candidatus Thermoplasmatota archaeon]|nr:hypothetical protein [Candidatus Thermoplasmatota archaeon]